MHIDPLETHQANKILPLPPQLLSFPVVIVLSMAIILLVTRLPLPIQRKDSRLTCASLQPPSSQCERHHRQPLLTCNHLLLNSQAARIYPHPHHRHHPPTPPLPPATTMLPHHPHSHPPHPPHPLPCISIIVLLVSLVTTNWLIQPTAVMEPTVPYLLPLLPPPPP